MNEPLRPTIESLLEENAALRARLDEADEALRAIRQGEIDALVVQGEGGPQVYTLQGLDAESNRFRGEILAQVSDAVIAVDGEQRVTWLNAAAERQYGVTAAGILGRGITEIRENRWLQQENEDEARRALSETGHWRGENIHVKRNGDEMYVESSLSQLPAEPGGAPGFLAIIRDITERKRAERRIRDSEQRLRAIFDGTHEYISLITPDGTLIEANRASLEFAGSKVEDVIGRPFWETVWFAFTPGAPKAIQEGVSRAAAGEFVSFEADIIRPNGDATTFFISFDPVRDFSGKVVLIVPVGVDITPQKEAVERLRASEEFNRTVLESSPDCVKVLDPDGSVLMMNGPGLCLLEIDDFAGVRGSPWWELWPETSRSKVRDAVRRAHRGETVHFEEFCPTAKGTPKWWDVVSSPVRDSAGNVDRIVSVSRDITERKHSEEKLRDSEERFRNIFEHAATGIAITNRDGRLLQCNPAYLALLEYSLEELQHIAFPSLIHPEDRAENMNMIRRLEHGEVTQFEIENRYVRKDGNTVWVHKFVSMLFDPSSARQHFVTLLTDVTARHHAEQALLEAKEDAESASRAKDDFLATLSHELRNPLNPVLLTASDMLFDPTLSPEQREAWEVVSKNVELESVLIDDLLDLTRITRGKMALTLANVDAHAVLKDAIQTVRSTFQEKHMVFRNELAAVRTTVSADAARLQQVFWNILNNAVKFTPAGGTVSVKTRDTSAGTILVEVSDTGIGMTAEELGRVFEAFAQGEHAHQTRGSHRFGGLGLGMAITSRLTEMHGGTIRAESSGRDRGAVFAIELPTINSPAAGNAPAAVLDASAAIIPGRLLLVEDHKPSRDSLARLLTRRCFDVTSAASVAEALVAAKAQSFDVVISDLGLPDGNGLELMVELRARLGPSVRTIAMSGYGTPEDLLRSRAAGFSAHLTKPVKIAALDAALKGIRGNSGH